MIAYTLKEQRWTLCFHAQDLPWLPTKPGCDSRSIFKVRTRVFQLGPLVLAGHDLSKLDIADHTTATEHVTQREEENTRKKFAFVLLI